MKTFYYIVFAIHILSVIAILALLLMQTKKNPKKLNPGILHATLTALVAGEIMYGTFKKVHPDEVLSHAKFGVKGLFIAILLTLGYSNVKKPVLKNSVWASMLGLTIFNVLVASFWH
jgi:preprotein translocase subunit SecG